jgi:microcystin-dependent protein
LDVNQTVVGDILALRSNGDAVVTVDNSGNLTVGGNLIVNGTTTTINTEQVLVEDNLITVNTGQTGAPISTLVSGIEVNRGSEPNYLFAFQESSQFFKIGLINELQAVATRDDVLGANRIPIWNNNDNKFTSRSDFVNVNGFVGIGKSNPSAPLDVVGNITSSGTITASTFSGPLSGNANTSTTLLNSRSINGTTFNGSADITTANWGTSRTITIGSSGKSVNGSGNVSWSLSEIGAAATNQTMNIGTTAVTINRASAAITLTGVSIDGNAGTATTLQNTRSINGTNFNGSAAITTANWGTARTITIGSSGKSINGGGNVSWSLSEIGISGTTNMIPKFTSATNTIGNSQIFDNGADVGIGTTNPSHKVQVIAGDFNGLSVSSTDSNRGVLVLKGNGDGASYTQYNGGLGSWYGIGFRCTLDGGTRHMFDTRTGNTTMTGTMSAGAITTTGNSTVGGDLTVSGTFAHVPTGTVIMYIATTAPTGFLLCNGSEVSRITYSRLFNVIGTTYGVGNNSTTFNLPDLRGRSPLGFGQGTNLTNRTLNQTGGSETHTLTVAEMPTHNHTASTNSTGAHTHTGTTATEGSHTHSGTTSVNGEHNHTSSRAIGDRWADAPDGGNDTGGVIGSYDNPLTSTNGNHSHTFTTGGGTAHSHTFTTASNGDHTHTVTVNNNGSNNAHNNMSPFIVLNFIIKF